MCHDIPSTQDTPMTFEKGEKPLKGMIYMEYTPASAVILIPSLEPDDRLPAYVRNFPRYGCINVHGSLLPKYRGAGPIQAAVINGDLDALVDALTVADQARRLQEGE